MTTEAVRTEPVRERRAPRWMWIALVLSVALNLLVVGVVASAAWHLRSGGFGPHARITRFLATLPQDRSEVLSKVVDSSQQAIRPLRREVWATRKDLARIFTAEPVDEEALAATVARLNDAEMKVRQAYAQLTTKLAKSMTAEERQAFAEWHEKRRRARYRSAGRDGESSEN